MSAMFEAFSVGGRSVVRAVGVAAVGLVSIASAADYTWDGYAKGYSTALDLTVWSNNGTGGSVDWPTYGNPGDASMRCLGSTGTGDWIKFDTKTLGTEWPATRFGAHVAIDGTAGRDIVKLDSTNGEVVCSLQIVTTGGWGYGNMVWEYVNLPTVWQAGFTARTVYVVFHGNNCGGYDGWRFEFQADGDLNTAINWSPNTVPGDGDSASFTFGLGRKDTLQWLANLSWVGRIGISASDSVTMRFDSVAAHRDTLLCDEYWINNKGNTFVPEGFTLLARRAMIGGFGALADGVYDSLTKPGRIFGGGQVIVDGTVPVRTPHATASAVAPVKMLQSADCIRILGLPARDAVVDIFDARGVRVLRGASTISLKGLAAGSYLVRAASGSIVKTWHATVGL